MALHFRNVTLAQSVLSFLIAVAAVIPVTIVIMIIAGISADPRAGGALAGMMGLVLFAGAFIISFVYLGLLNTTRTTMDRARIRAKAVG
jgi:uncharacterized RDD family membrane protein YckC